MYAKSGVKSGSGQSWWTIIENGLLGRWTILERTDCSSENDN